MPTPPHWDVYFEYLLCACLTYIEPMMMGAQVFNPSSSTTQTPGDPGLLSGVGVRGCPSPSSWSSITPRGLRPLKTPSRLRTPRRATQSLPRWTTFPTGLRAASFRLPSAGRLREVSWSPALCKRERGRCEFGFPLVSLRDLESVS